LGLAVGTNGLRERTAGPTGPAGELALPSGKWIPVASLADLDAKGVLPVDAGAVPAFIIRDGDSVRAISRVCTHMGCLLRHDAPDPGFTCPCHGAWFDLHGNVDSDYGLSLPQLPSVGVRVVQGTIYVLGA
jgi:nitrite reductase/ring-hydroxylating ferredoxin subunit